LIASALLAALAGAPAAAQLKVAAKGTKTVTINDRVGANQFTWNSDAPLEKIRGTAEGVSGSFSFDPARLTSLRGTITAQVATMKTGNATRDQHLRGNQWLDATRFPEIKFTISSVTGVKVRGNKATGKAVGTFTLHGVSKRLTVPFTMTYLDASDATRKRAAGDLVMISSDFSISLRDFNVAGQKGMIGSKVGEKIRISAKLFGSTS
jgi:polyisoprenoid-binding protein YceI